MSDTPGPSRGSQLLELWRAQWTQIKAAEHLELDAATYSRFENGIRQPSAKVGFRIERLTECRVPAKSWYDPAVKHVTDRARAS